MQWAALVPVHPFVCVHAYIYTQREACLLQNAPGAMWHDAHGAFLQHQKARQKLSRCVFSVNDIPSTGSYCSLCPGIPLNIPSTISGLTWMKQGCHITSLLSAYALASWQSLALGL